MEQELLQAKWEDYLFLTNEMKKFLCTGDFDLFYSLLDQRIVMEEQIKIVSNNTYYSSASGKKLLLQIQQANREMLQQFYFIFNSNKRGQSVSRAYESSGDFAGGFINRQT